MAQRGYIRNGFGAVRPYLYGTSAVVDLVTGAFGAQVLERHVYEDRTAAAHVEVQIDDSVLVIEAKDPPYEHATPASVLIYVSDVDAVYAAAMAAGATSVVAPEDKPYQERSAGVRDAFGNTWWLSTYRLER